MEIGLRLGEGGEKKMKNIGLEKYPIITGHRHPSRPIQMVSREETNRRDAGPDWESQDEIDQGKPRNLHGERAEAQVGVV